MLHGEGNRYCQNNTHTEAMTESRVSELKGKPLKTVKASIQLWLFLLGQ